MSTVLVELHPHVAAASSCTTIMSPLSTFHVVTNGHPLILNTPDPEIATAVEVLIHETVMGVELYV